MQAHYRFLSAESLVMKIDQIQSRPALILSGILGLTGAVLMLAGDLLFYAHWGDIPQYHDAIEKLVPARMSILLASPLQLHISGILGPIAAFFYLFGAWHIYQCIDRYSKAWAKVTCFAFGFGFVASGSYHALWSLYGLIIQFSNAQTTYRLICWMPAKATCLL